MATHGPPEPVPGDSGEAPAIAAQLAQLTARVYNLERELALLRSAIHPAASAPSSAQEPSPQPPVAQLQPTVPPPPPKPATTESPHPITPTQPPKSQPSLETRLGAQVFNRIGIIALLTAATLGLKLAIDNHWVGPIGRVLIGLIAGAALILWSERFRRRNFAAFSYSLKAVGTGVLYLSLWAAFHLYHLLPSSVALIGMILVTAWNAFMAWTQDAELLAAYAVSGGLATPLLLSTGGSHERFLFTYLLALDVAVVVLLRAKPWTRLLWMAFPATVLYFSGWYSRWYREPDFATTAVFITLFFATFVSISIGRRKTIEGVIPSGTEGAFEERGPQRARSLGLAEPPHFARSATTASSRALGRHAREILLPLANAAFTSLAFAAAMEDSHRHWFLPWLMLILSAAYLLITRLPQTAAPAAVHLSLTVVFLTIAIPLKASGHWITISWLIEGVALLWAASRLSAPEHANSSAVLRWLAAASLVLGLAGLIANEYWVDAAITQTFLNHNLATALIAAAVLAIAAWLSLKQPDAHWHQLAFASLAAIGGVALLLSLREIATTRFATIPHPAFATVDFALAIVAIALLSALAWSTLRIAREYKAEHTPNLLWPELSAVAIIAINLIAVLTGVREIGSLGILVGSTTGPANTNANPELALQRALAVSAFLMLYGAALLAIGFWRRSAFVRWQALALIVFTIAKVFLYDLSSLSQVYRFLSFLALGALLMAISFAYQKDWLGLRNPQPRDEAPAASPEGDPSR